MSDKKTYSITGRVEIGTDEYRDLIEAVATKQAELEEMRRRYWELEGKRAEVEKKLANATAELAKEKERNEVAMNFINQTKSRKISFCAYLNDLEGFIND